MVGKVGVGLLNGVVGCLARSAQYLSQSTTLARSKVFVIRRTRRQSHRQDLPPVCAVGEGIHTCSEPVLVGEVVAPGLEVLSDDRVRRKRSDAHRPQDLLGEGVV